LLGASYDENRPAATFEACRSKDWVTTQSSHVVSRLCLSSQTPVIQRARSDTAISARRASRNTPGGSYDAMVRHGAPPASDRAPDWSRHLHLQVPRNRSFPCPNEHPPTPCLLCPTQYSNFRGQTRSFHYTLLSVRTPHRFAPSLCLQEGGGDARDRSCTFCAPFSRHSPCSRLTDRTLPALPPPGEGLVLI
jgi:hypothetical protein